MRTKLFASVHHATLLVLMLGFLESNSLVARAQTTAFTYQGVLADGGVPANGVYDFQFRLFNAVSGGAQQAVTVSIADFAVTNGLFTVALDFNAAPFDGGDLWLQVALRPGASSDAYTNLVPRQKINATPYAIQSANAGTAVSVSGLVSAAQLTGAISSNNIGAGSITSAMLATGAVGSNQLASGAVTTMALADGVVTADKVATVSNRFTLTVANPTPASVDYFGNSVAAMGSDRVLIGAMLDDTGAMNAGAAYLFRAEGTLLTTFTNPTPAVSDNFGNPVAALGNDRVLIGAMQDDTGATDAGSAYLFSVSGILLTTFTNPTPAVSDLFGNLAAFGNDRVIISAQLDDTGATNAGVAYLFRTNGTLLTTFTNPTPAVGDSFGYPVASVGSDRVLIGAYGDDTGAADSGAAYLFDTNGTLLVTFINPTPANGDFFGLSGAVLGSDRVLIGAYGDDTGTTDSGAAYLFNINGTLLATFTNPTPAVNDRFGWSVAAMGNDRVLIGAYADDTGFADAGSVYVFSTNGTLLTTFANPTPAVSDLFGYSVAALGNDGVLVGAYGDDTSTNDAGSAYLFMTETFTDGLVADGVRHGSVDALSLADGAVNVTKLADGAVTTPKLADGAVTAAKLDPAIGVWTRAGDNVHRLSGNVGIGTTTPGMPLQVGDPGIPDSLGMVRLASRGSQGSVRTWDIGVPEGDGDVTGKFYSFIIDDTALGTNPEFMVQWGTGNVGIGTTSPTRDIHVVGTDSRLRLEGTSSLASAMTEFVTDARTWHVGTSNGALNGSFSIIDAAVGRHRLQIFTNGWMTLDAGVEIRFDLFVYGGAYKPGGGSWGSASDVRLKKNVRPLSGALDTLLALRGVNFEFIDPEKIHELSGERMGLIAQEVEKVIPDWVETGSDGYKRVTVRGLEALVVEALRELHQRQDANNTKLAEELKRRDAENVELRRRLERLERLLDDKTGGEK